MLCARLRRDTAVVDISASRFIFRRNVCAACTQDEVNKIFDSAKAAQKVWAKTPLWKRAELLHKAAGFLRANKEPMADCLVAEVAKGAKDSLTEVSSAFVHRRIL